MLRLPSDRAVETDEPLLGELVRKGLAVAEGNGAEPRDERLKEASWNLYAALYHARSRWSGVDLGIGDGDAAADALSAATRAQSTATARRRRTSTPRRTPSRRGACRSSSGKAASTTRSPVARPRAASTNRAASARTSSRCSCGPCSESRAQRRSPAAAPGVRRTSPSGGGLHPVEAYPLVLDADGVEPGLYHYHSGEHALELVERLSRPEAEELAEQFTCGQGYFRHASLLVVLAARFGRSFWKYRGHEKAYAVTLMDAGHLSQTFYLVCAELGLGAFVTAAINNVDIDERLGLDGFAEGSLAISGCGPLVEESSYLQPRFEPHRPAG